MLWLIALLLPTAHAGNITCPVGGTIQQFLNMTEPCDLMASFNTFQFRLTGYTNTYGVDAAVPTFTVDATYPSSPKFVFQGPWHGNGSISFDADLFFPQLRVPGDLWSIREWSSWQGIGYCPTGGGSCIGDPFTVVLTENITGDLSFPSSHTFVYSGGSDTPTAGPVDPLNLTTAALHVHWQTSFTQGPVSPPNGYFVVPGDSGIVSSGFLITAPQEVPEPGTFLWLLSGLGAIAAMKALTARRVLELRQK